MYKFYSVDDTWYQNSKECIPVMVSLNRNDPGMIEIYKNYIKRTKLVKAGSSI